ncbi:serpin family protein [Bifidobacterium leontopitheci]|uniref:Serpin n=1 Tax=Bifidobacterium leontopitheci TaxID=2650774 RepID=A0A6I1GSI7_9BIFI|nr:serpin family protein [Bifidobacterium leontopitheci]KAB7791158.1 serpin [Bifidobacterium leontopitheci]
MQDDENETLFDDDDDDWTDDDWCSTFEYDEDTPPAPEAPECVTEAIRRFAHASAPMFLTVDGNVNYSPASLWTALALVATGAAGETRRELESMLGSADIGADDLGLFRDALNATRIHQIADSLWVHDGIALHEDWLDGMRRCAAEVFGHEPFDQSTGRRMSDWIDAHTHGMLKPEIDTNPDDVLVLIDALVSNGRWLCTFDEQLTCPEMFHGVRGDTPTPMMHDVSTVTGYLRGDGWTKATLPFSGYSGGVSVILPDDSMCLDRLLHDRLLLEDALDAPAESSWRRLVDLSMPRFITDSTFDAASLRMRLSAMGITRAFDPDLADFSDMSDNPLHIGQVIQETRMEVTEEGAKAAAYTMIRVLAAGAPPEPDTTVTVRVDRPFIYTLYANLPGSSHTIPLFLGILRDPESPETEL